MRYPRQTHTFALLEVPRFVYDDVRARLEAAGYQSAIDEEGTIDLHGLALQVGDSAPAEQGEPITHIEVTALIERALLNLHEVERELEELLTIQIETTAERLRAAPEERAAAGPAPGPPDRSKELEINWAALRDPPGERRGQLPPSPEAER